MGLAVVGGLVVFVIARFVWGGVRAAKAYDEIARSNFGMSFRELRDACDITTAEAQRLLDNPRAMSMLRENWARFGRPILSYSEASRRAADGEGKARKDRE